MSAARARYLWGYRGELLNPVGLGRLLSVWLEGGSVIRRKKKQTFKTNYVNKLFSANYFQQSIL